MSDPYLELTDLRIRAGARDVVRRATLRLEPGRILALVGASGSGKTLTARACLGLVPTHPGIVGGALVVSDGHDTWRPLALPPKARQAAFQALRGRVVGWLPQEARASLDPVRSVGAQVRAVLILRSRDGIALPVDRPRVEDWLGAAGFPEPSRVVRLYPHELSGGMAERACIALALARGSRFLLADEPTTGLDPTVQAAILDQLGQLRQQGCGLLLITHDLRIVPRYADDVAVMDDGDVVEHMPADRLSHATSAPARALLSATARVAGGLL